MEEEKLLEEYFNKLLELFKNRKSIEYEIIKSVKEEDHIQFTIKIRTLNQKRVIKFLNNEENNTYIKSDDEYSYFMVSLNKNILEKSFIQEEAYDNSEEIWRLHILSNNKLKKENGAYYYDNDIDIEISGDVVFNFNDKSIFIAASYAIHIPITIPTIFANTLEYTIISTPIIIAIIPYIRS